jgi:hypothetical protein
VEAERGQAVMTISKETFDMWKNQPIFHDEDDWNGKYSTYGEMWRGEGCTVEDKQKAGVSE